MHTLPGQDIAQFKVPLIGDANVGKTSIVSRYTTEIFTANVSSTVGVSTVNIGFNIKGRRAELSVWDTAGQEKFRSLVPLYARHASLMILVFDMSCSSSFEGAADWLNKIRNDMGVKCPIFLCGNKTDLPSVISQDAVRVWAQRNTCVPFFTSALTGDGVAEMFQQAANTLVVTIGERQTAAGQNIATMSEKSCC
jgi:small GTP-binding protein